MNSKSTPTPPNSSGICQCGCGEMTSIAKQTNRRTGRVRGEHVRFVYGHGGRKYPRGYTIDPVTA